LLALVALPLPPVPAKIVYQKMREVLLVANPDDEVAQRLQKVMREVEAQHDIASCSTHIAKTGRIHVVEIDIVVGESSELRSVQELDTLRICDAIGLPIEQAWLGILFTADERWS
jgi:predicted Co/Zn/Cd cation transporter (cation efflux family)